MRYSTKVSDATHILIYVHVYAGYDLSSTAIAQSVKTNPAVIRRLMTDLTAAGLLRTVKGKADPQLARPLEDITLLDVYRAVEQVPLLHVDEETSLQCFVGSNIQAALGASFNQIQTAAEEQMAQITVQSILDSFEKPQQQA
jgi:DNA-binding IscR family transcriptional regulator